MTPADILCRCCGKDYGGYEGCGICEPAKRNITWPAMQESVAADLAGVSRRIVKMLDGQVTGLQKQLALVPGGYDPVLAQQAAALARAVAAVLTEARKLEEHEAAKVKGEGFDGQLEIFIEWLAGLPREYQRKALGGMERLLLPPAEAADVLSD